MPNLARQLLDDAAARGITLRLTGSIAVRERCARLPGLLERLDREPPIDIDLVGYAKQRAQISQLFKDLGYRIDPVIAQSQEWGIPRLIFHGPDGKPKVDVFLDVLRMSHTIDFKDRLVLEPVTTSPVDLLLAKLQIHEITEKDYKDTIALLVVHDLGRSAPGTIDVQYLGRVAGRDWGLYYTLSKNLGLVETWLDGHPALLPEETTLVRARLSELQRVIEVEPKSMRWRMRAAVGPRVQWYEDVGDVDR